MVQRCRKKAPIITHLSYADDIIIFSRAHREAVEKLVGCLHHYIAASGQMVNNGKIQFYLGDEHIEFAGVVEDVGGFQRGVMPFTYLGVPIFRGARRADHLLPLRQKLMERIHSWSHRHLAFGGRLALIKSTLAAIPLHILQVMSPLLGFLDELEQIMARFFWGTVGEKRKLHWISWRQICLPFDEGGLGIRRFREMSVAFGFKLWWRLLAQDSLWAQFMTQKYSIRPCHLHTSPCWSHDSLLGVVCVIFGHTCMILFVGPWVMGRSDFGMMSGLGLAPSGIYASQEMILLNPRRLHHIGMNMHGMRICCIVCLLGLTYLQM